MTTTPFNERYSALITADNQGQTLVTPEAINQLAKATGNTGSSATADYNFVVGIVTDITSAAMGGPLRIPGNETASLLVNIESNYWRRHQNLLANLAMMAVHGNDHSLY